MIKNKNLILSIIFLIFLFGSTQFSSAAELEDGPCASSPDLGSCVVNYFQWGIGIAGIIAVLSFTIGAVTYMISGGSSDLASSGKDRMKGSVLGILLLGSSYLIMSTINFALVQPTITPQGSSTLPPMKNAPGVYLYSDTNCQKFVKFSVSSTDSLGSDIKSIKIVNDANNVYGFLLHKEDYLSRGGECDEPVLNQTSCVKNTKYGAIDIFKLNKNPITSGSGIGFYSEPYGLDRGSRAGYLLVQANSIQANQKNAKTPDSMNFVFTGVNVPDAYKTTQCPTFQKCAGSIDIKGNYLVAIYSDITTGSAGGTSSYCQTFTKNVENLNAEPIVAAGATKLKTIYIIATGGIY